MGVQINDQTYRLSIFILILYNSYSIIGSATVRIEGPKTILVGSTVTFEVFLDYGSDSSYNYLWSDNYDPPHTAQFESSKPHSSWSITYPMNNTKLGMYKVSVKVYHNFFINIEIGEAKKYINVTNQLSGKMQLIQNTTIRNDRFVSTKIPVNHTIELLPHEAKFLSENATKVYTYWFQNYTCVGVSNNFSYHSQYNESNRNYVIEAYVVASFEKDPDILPTTTASTTITTAETITTALPTSTIAPTISTTAETKKTIKKMSVETSPMPITKTTTNQPKMKMKRDTARTMNEKSQNHVETTVSRLIDSSLNTTFISNNNTEILNMNTSTITTTTTTTTTPTPQLICDSNSLTQNESPMYLYGYYNRVIVTKDPISNFSVNGQNWLPHGTLLDMDVNCKGSPDIEYCTSVFNAPYNATGNEDCENYFDIDECHIKYRRYFSESKTVLFFMRNDVSQTMNQVTINIYEAKKQSQLSVVVVPVAFTLVAIILIVFGVSYYIQSRNRFQVEVANFNFGETQSLDMEYKTFPQRLYESLRDIWPIRWHWMRFHNDTDSDSNITGNNSLMENNTNNDIISQTIQQQQ